MAAAMLVTAAAMLMISAAVLTADTAVVLSVVVAVCFGAEFELTCEQSLNSLIRIA